MSSVVIFGFNKEYGSVCYDKKWVELGRTPEYMALVLKYLTVLSFLFKTVFQCIHNRMYNFAMKAEFKTNWMSQNDY